MRKVIREQIVDFITDERNLKYAGYVLVISFAGAMIPALFFAVGAAYAIVFLFAGTIARMAIGKVDEDEEYEAYMDEADERFHEEKAAKKQKNF